MYKLDELRTIISFIQAAQSGSFTIAADILGITPAAVSKNVSTLEKSLGVRLFNRTTRSLSLTGEGQAFLEHACQAVDILSQASEALRQSGEHPRGVVKISLPNAIGKLCVIPHLDELNELYPDIVLDLDFDNRIVDFVRDGFDLVIRGGHIQDSSLISRRVGQLNTCLVASHQYLDKYGEPKHYSELLNHRLIIRRFSNGKYMPWLFRQPDGSLISIDLAQRSLVVTEPEAAFYAALQGLGVGHVARYIAQEAIDKGLLKQVLIKDYHGEKFDLVLQYPHRALLAPRVRVVAEFLVEKLSADKRLHG